MALALAVISFAQQDYRDVVIGDDPVAFYEFEDSSSGDGDMCADTMGNHNAVYISDANQGRDVTLAPNSWSSILGNAATFYGSSGGGNGTGVAISGGNASGLELQTMSVEFLIKAPFNQYTYQRIYSHADGQTPCPEIYGGLGDARQIAVDSNSGTWYTNYASSPVFDNQWHHVVVTMDYNSVTDQTVMKWYYDGGLVDTSTQAGGYDYSGLASWSDPMIGANGNPGYLYNGFVGTLDEVATYDYALSDAQVLAHHGFNYYYPGDINHDWKVDFKDFAKLGSYWLTIYDYDKLADIAEDWLAGY
jgi:hypothetical protein